MNKKLPHARPGARALPTAAMQLDLFRDDFRLRECPSLRARSIRIEVRPDREVRLIYPRWAARADALAFLRAREDWVRAKLAELQARADGCPPPPPVRWDGRDEILLQGQTVPVCIEVATLRQIQVRIEPGLITLFVPGTARDDARQLERALRRALIQQAQRQARRLLDEEAMRAQLRWTALSIADPQTQWGSCAADGRIMLSWRLIMAPPPVFRYVVVHELCHLVHMNHSPDFWAQVERQMPDYQIHKRWLRDHGGRLYHYLPRRRARA